MFPAIAWICSIIGLGVTWVYLLGLAMSTVPGKLSLLAALGLSILPAIALLAIFVGFSKSLAAHQQVKAALIYVVPLLISLFTLFQLAISCDTPIHRWLRSAGSGSSGMSETVYERDGTTPHFQMEIRPVLETPAEGTTTMTIVRSNESFLVGKDVLFTNADIQSTSVRGPYSVTGWAIGIKFTEEAKPKVEELSRRDTDKKWAILLNGEILTAPTIRMPFSDEVVIEGGFDHQEASNYARGMVQAF